MGEGEVPKLIGREPGRVDVDVGQRADLLHALLIHLQAFLKRIALGLQRVDVAGEAVAGEQLGLVAVKQHEMRLQPLEGAEYLYGVLGVPDLHDDDGELIGRVGLEFGAQSRQNHVGDVLYQPISQFLKDMGYRRFASPGDAGEQYDVPLPFHHLPLT